METNSQQTDLTMKDCFGTCVTKVVLLNEMPPDAANAIETVSLAHCIQLGFVCIYMGGGVYFFEPGQLPRRSTI